MRKITSICKSNQALKKDVLVRLEGTLECLTSCSTELQRIAIHVILSRPVMPYLMCCHFQCTLFYPARQAFYVCCARRISVRPKHSSLQHCDLNDSFPKSQHSHRHCITARALLYNRLSPPGPDDGFANCAAARFFSMLRRETYVRDTMSTGLRRIKSQFQCTVSGCLWDDIQASKNRSYGVEHQYFTSRCFDCTEMGDLDSPEQLDRHVLSLYDRSSRPEGLQTL